MIASVWIGRTKQELDTPALALDLDLLGRNLSRMQKLVARAGLQYRPHTKSHKSPLIAHKQLAAGAIGVCCAKLGEAEVMVAGGIDDILITTPVVERAKIRRLAALARHARMAVVVDDEKNIEDLSQAAAEAAARLEVLVEVDVGQRRCGVPPGPTAVSLAEKITRS